MILVLGRIGLRSYFRLSTVVFLLNKDTLLFIDERNPGVARVVVARLEHEPNTFFKPGPLPGMKSWFWTYWETVAGARPEFRVRGATHLPMQGCA